MRFGFFSRFGSGRDWRSLRVARRRECGGGPRTSEPFEISSRRKISFFEYSELMMISMSLFTSAWNWNCSPPLAASSSDLRPTGMFAHGEAVGVAAAPATAKRQRARTRIWYSGRGSIKNAWRGLRGFWQAR